MRSPRALALSAIAVLAFASLPSSVLTQALTGSIEGRVTDDSGAVIPGVGVTASGVSVGGSHQAITNVQGRYLVAGLTPGKYRLRADLAGFKPMEMELTVSAGQTIKRDIVLSVASLAETVSVTAATPTIDTRSSAAGSTIVFRSGAAAGAGQAGGRAYAAPPTRHYPPPWWRPGAPFNTTSFDAIDENAFVKAVDTPLSTFA